MEYSDYRNIVLSKTNGASIHRVNGLLGTVLNQMNNAIYWGKIGDSRRLGYLERVSLAVSEIKGITGVEWRWMDMYYRAIENGNK